MIPAVRTEQEMKKKRKKKEKKKEKKRRRKMLKEIKITQSADRFVAFVFRLHF
mgnify:CR=1 FL=1